MDLKKQESMTTDHAFKLAKEEYARKKALQMVLGDNPSGLGAGYVNETERETFGRVYEMILSRFES